MYVLVSEAAIDATRDLSGQYTSRELLFLMSDDFFSEMSQSAVSAAETEIVLWIRYGSLGELEQKQGERMSLSKPSQ